MPTDTRPPPLWHTLTPGDVASRLGVDPERGLSSDEAARRLESQGRNELTSEPPRPRWLLFIDQFRSAIVAILAGAAVLAGVVGDLKDTAIIAVVLLLNALLGFVQEARASDALAALKRMLVASVRVRRDGRLDDIAAPEVVPGDVVVLEAGDRVPADGRIVVSAGLAVDEAPLTGESQPVDKEANALAPDDAGAGDRLGMVFMNTTVTRGRAEVVVTSTGMQTEMGAVAGMLAGEETGPTPLQRQLDRLGKRLAGVAVVAVLAVFILQTTQGLGVGEALLGAVALAVAAIPEGLPAVVTVTLAVGTARMAKRNAIVKRLHSVETLGSTTVICSDKTGTLTLNQMTARAFVVGGRTIAVGDPGDTRPSEASSAKGDTDPGVDSSPDDTTAADALRPSLLAATLCSDAEARATEDGTDAVGDPTETSILVAATDIGIDVSAERVGHPRIAELPFDSAAKFMATFHHRPGDDEVLVCVKGAPDVLVDRSTTWVGPGGSPEPLDDEAATDRGEDNDRLAARGMRVLAVATRWVPADEALTSEGTVADPQRWVDDLTLEGLVGIVDPPRHEARDAIGLCRTAGVAVKMITGDHAATAGAIAAELGIEGSVMTGAELSAIDEDELAEVVDGIGVFARVSPEHKVRVVRALQARGHVVAMTGDGVNDAPALRRADIGVAMGITGTDVTKEAGDMVLTDDNFATIVAAVRQGRAIYDNIVKFVRFQLTTNLGAIATILGASLAGLPVPFNPLQVLWVNLIADGPPAITLGLDPPEPNVMERRPRPQGVGILTRWRLTGMVAMGVFMAAGVLGLFLWSRERWSEEVALTMAFTTFVLQQMVNVFNARAGTATVFRRQTFTNPRLWMAIGGVVLLQVLAVTWGPLRSVFDTTALGWAEWGACLGVAATVLVIGEVARALGRWRRRHHVTPDADPPTDESDTKATPVVSAAA